MNHFPYPPPSQKEVMESSSSAPPAEPSGAEWECHYKTGSVNKCPVEPILLCACQNPSASPEVSFRYSHLSCFQDTPQPPSRTFRQNWFIESFSFIWHILKGSFVKTKVSPTSPQIIHESRDSKHRIVKLNPNGTNDSSAWASVSELAILGPLLANADPENGLPIGIFTVRSVAAQVLI